MKCHETQRQRIFTPIGKGLLLLYILYRFPIGSINFRPIVLGHNMGNDMKTKQDIIQRLLDFSNEIDRTAVIILEQQETAIIENTRLGINIHLN